MPAQMRERSWWRRVIDVVRDQRLPRDATALRFRIENFGAILQSLNPRALIFVDRDYATRWARRIGTTIPTWDRAAPVGDVRTLRRSEPRPAVPRTMVGGFV